MDLIDIKNEIVIEYENGKDCANIASLYSWVSVDDVKNVLVDNGYAEEDLRV